MIVIQYSLQGDTVFEEVNVQHFYDNVESILPKGDDVCQVCTASQRPFSQIVIFVIMNGKKQGILVFINKK